LTVGCFSATPLKTLQQYILVSQDKALVELYVRNADTSWTLIAFGAAGNVDVAAIQCTLIVDDLYEGLTLGQQASTSNPL
jgi:hypothetical protein